MIGTVLSLTLAAAPQTSLDALPQGPARGLETYSLHGLHCSARYPTPPPFGSFLHRHLDLDEVQYISHWEGEREQFGSDLIAEILSEHYLDAVEDGRLTLEPLGRTLVVTGDAEITTNVGQTLTQLEALVARPVAITATLYRWHRDDPAPAFAKAEQLRKVTGELEVLWTATARTRSGVPIALGKERWTPYVRDVDVEVAQDSKIGDPKVDRIFEGIRLLVEPHALTGSEDLAMFAQVAFGQRREPMQLRATGIEENPSLDVPHVDLNCGTISGRVQAGGALLLTVTGEPAAGSRLMLAISPRYEAPPMANTLGDLQLFPISALTTSSLQHGRVTIQYPRLPGFDESFEDDDDSRNYGSVDADALMELVQQSMPALFEVDGTSIQATGGYLCVRAPREDLARIEAVLRGLQDRWLRNVELDFHTRAAAAGQGDDLFAGSATNNGGATLHRVVIPALQGRHHVFMRGTETTSLLDYEVEIAQEASTANPVVELEFRGIALTARPVATQSGVDLDMMVHVTDVPSPTRRPLEAKSGGDLYMAASNLARFTYNGNVVDGQSVELGDGPLVASDSGNWHTVQVLRVTTR